MREIEFPPVEQAQRIEWTPFWKRPIIAEWLQDGLAGVLIFAGLWILYHLAF